MKKTIIIVGAGPGIGLSVAEKFGSKGYQIGLINRNAETAPKLLDILHNKGIAAVSQLADVSDSQALAQALHSLKETLGRVDVLVYNAMSSRFSDILLEEESDLLADYKVNIVGAITSIRVLKEELSKNKGAILLTGGGLAHHPMSALGSLSLGKAALLNLAKQLHVSLGEEGVYVGTITINGAVNPDSSTHSPLLIAEKILQIEEQRSDIEVVY